MASSSGKAMLHGPSSVREGMLHPHLGWCTMMSDINALSAVLHMLAQYFSIMGPDDWLVCEVTTIRTVINILIYTSVCVCVRARACECE